MDHEKGLATTQSSQRALAMIQNMDIKRSGSMSITLVDAGMVAQLNDHESSTFIGLLSSIGSGNGREAAQFALQFSLENQKLTTEQEQDFTRDMIELFEERCRGYGTNVDVGDVLRGVLGLVRKHQLRVDANFATLVVKYGAS
jgi:aarF domain-containing kinase